MSLINDALKRASQTERARPRDPGLSSPMQPAVESRRSIVPVVAGVFILALLAAAGWLVWRALPQQHSPATLPAVGLTNVTARQSLALPRIELRPAAALAKEDAPAVVMPLPDSNPPVSPPPAPAPAPVVVPEALPFPDLKLQGIFYNRANPKVAINGQIRAENELIGEVRIVKITQNKVTVEWNGQTKDLSLGGQ
jgi:hypothetical protein